MTRLFLPLMRLMRRLPMAQKFRHHLCGFCDPGALFVGDGGE